jgi:hypothetical protein
MDFDRDRDGALSGGNPLKRRAVSSIFGSSGSLCELEHRLMASDAGAGQQGTGGHHDGSASTSDRPSARASLAGGAQASEDSNEATAVPGSTAQTSPVDLANGADSLGLQSPGFLQTCGQALGMGGTPMHGTVPQLDAHASSLQLQALLAGQGEWPFQQQLANCDPAPSWYGDPSMNTSDLAMGSMPNGNATGPKRHVGAVEDGSSYATSHVQDLPPRLAPVVNTSHRSMPSIPPVVEAQPYPPTSQPRVMDPSGCSAACDHKSLHESSGFVAMGANSQRLPAPAQTQAGSAGLYTGPSCGGRQEPARSSAPANSAAPQLEMSSWFQAADRVRALPAPTDLFVHWPRCLCRRP